MKTWRAFGVRLESEIPLDGLPEVSGAELATVKVLLERTPHDTEQRTSPVPDVEALIDGRPLSLRVNGELEVCWRGVVTFRAAIGDSVIRCQRGPEGSIEQAREWLLHYMLPLLLQTERHLHFLHGSAVQIGAGAVGFLAPSGGGKSTLMEHFVRRGHAFLTDDKLGIVRCEGGFAAVPGAPFYRRGEAKGQWRPVGNFASSPLPLRTLYLLAPADRNVTPLVTPLLAREAPFALAARCELRLPARVRQRLGLGPFAAERFYDCSELAAAVRVCRLRVPQDLSRLPDVYQSVVADAAGCE